LKFLYQINKNFILFMYSCFFNFFILQHCWSVLYPCLPNFDKGLLNCMKTLRFLISVYCFLRVHTLFFFSNLCLLMLIIINLFTFEYCLPDGTLILMLTLFPWLWICNFYFLIYQGSPEETKPVQIDSRRSPQKTNEQVLSKLWFNLWRRNLLYLLIWDYAKVDNLINC